jgi:hypothetical protein
LQAKPQLLALHVVWACETVVVHAAAHEPQCAGSLVRSVQVDPQSVGAPAGQPEVQAYPLPDAAQTGRFAGHAVVQLPQWPCCVTSVSQPSSGLLVQCAQPDAQDDAPKVQVPEAEQATLPLTCGSAVQS